MRLSVTGIICFFLFDCFGQIKQSDDSLSTEYHAEMRIVSNAFSKAYYPNRTAIYSLNEIQFIKQIDSLKRPFLNVINRYTASFDLIDQNFIPGEKRDTEYFFDRIVLDYPYFHENYTEKKVKLSNTTQARLNLHLSDFNNPDILSSKDFQGYVVAFLRHKSSDEVKKDIYKNSDNKRLDAHLNLIPRYFTNQQCLEFWNYYYLFTHLDNFGSKNIDNVIKAFRTTCTNAVYTKTIDSIYTESVNAYKGHSIHTYKTVDGFKLDLHTFIPDTSDYKTKRPAIVYFSGGSWTEGTPEWDFYNCEKYASKGWVAVSVEYRVADRYETTPIEAVKDARSAIRWLRMNADTYNIDPNRIVVSGNSAGGHLALTTALANEVNESTDNINYSAAPNLLLVNSGVYDLFADESTAWISSGHNKNIIKRISPLQLLKGGLPPMLIIHGTNDQSVDYASAKAFAEAMKELGNEFEFQTIDEAPHYIWYDRRFSGKVAGWRKEFLKKYGYE